VVTQGKNLFAEELEAVLQAHPAVALASVHGVADPRRGAQVVALIQWTQVTTLSHPSAAQIKAWCRQHLETYKAPRKVFVCNDWPLTASGKTDHPKLEAHLLAHLDQPTQKEPPCLSLLP
jgi:long-chain acyl-CoA synthetase